MGLYSGRLIIGRIFASQIWGLIFGRTYIREGLLLEFYRYDFITQTHTMCTLTTPTGTFCLPLQVGIVVFHRPSLHCIAGEPFKT